MLGEDVDARSATAPNIDRLRCPVPVLHPAWMTPVTPGNSRVTRHGGDPRSTKGLATPVSWIHHTPGRTLSRKVRR